MLLHDRTDAPSRDALQQLIVCHHNADGDDRKPRQKDGIGNGMVEKFGLLERARIAIQDVPAMRVVLLQAVENHLVDDLVVHQQPCAHDLFRLEPQLGAAGDVAAQQVAGGDLRNAVLGDQQLCLRTLANAGCA